MAFQHTTSMLRGICIELLHIGEAPAKLFLLFDNNFDASLCLKSGDLFVHMIAGLGSPLAMISCMVGGHQWMLVKDSMVLRVTPQAFVLSLPGFIYGLTLPTDCNHHVNKLEDIFKRFCSYQDLLTESGAENDEVGAETDLWRLAYSRIERLAGAAGNSIIGGAAEINSAIRKHQRAVMTSLLVRLVSHNLLSGVLSPPNHVHLVVTRGGPEPDSLGLCFLPSMWTFVELLDLLYTGSSPTLSLPMAAAAAHLLDIDLLNAREAGSLLAIPLAAAAAAPVGWYGRWYISNEGKILLLNSIISLVRRIMGSLSVIRQLRPDQEAEKTDDENGNGELANSGEALGSAE